MTRLARTVRTRLANRVLRELGTALAACTVVVLGLSGPAAGQFAQEELERNAKLTPAMRKLILAYENYVHLYPNTTRARDFLLDEAGRFRDVGDQETAIVAFRRTLDRPDMTQANRAYVYEQIMDAYRVMGQFERQEEWAHRMATADVGAEKQQQAKDFIFGAGYNRAKALEDSGQAEQAAEAYERLAVKNPDHRQAPNAMLRAAILYEEGGNKARAALTYERFYYTYPDFRSPDTGAGALVALENAATLYLELNDNRHAADAVERILAAAPTHAKRKDYLQSLAAIYQLLNDYNNAIRVRQQFIESYPRDLLAGSYQWDIAEFRGLAGQRQQALAEYEAFVRSYPGDFRAVEANYRMGMDRLAARTRSLDEGQPDRGAALYAEARRHFERAYGLHDSLVAKVDRGGGDLEHALGAVVQVARMDSAEYYAIGLRGSQTFKSDSTRKWETLQKTSQIYLKVANYGYPPTTFEALYKRGRLLEDFAHQYLLQPRPDTAITYDQILKVFFINSVSQRILADAAIPAYQRQTLDFYEENRPTIDSAAAGLASPDLRQAHTRWLERARERVAAIPAKVDSLELNTISYEADMLVLDAQEQIPRRFETAWGQFQQQHATRYQEDPKLVYADRQQVFDMTVAPLVYGAGPADTTAMVPRFQDIITKGGKLGDQWTSYNRGRLRLVYGARSNYYKMVSDEGVGGLGGQLGTLRQQSDDLVTLIGSLPKLDLSSLGPPPERPDLTPPQPPERPPGEPATWGNERALRFINAYKAYIQAVKNLQYRVQRYQNAVGRYQTRRQELYQRLMAQNADIMQRTRAEVQVFGRRTLDTHLYRYAIENVVGRASGALERDIAFGDSVGYSPADRRAVRDSALAFSLGSAERLDSLYQVVNGIRQLYETGRDTAAGGEGSPAFQVINNLVTGYASVADSFRTSTVRRYMYIYRGRDSLFAAGLDNPIVARAISRLKQLDPTFGTQAIARTFTFVTEDSSGAWRVATTVDKDDPDAWKEMAFNDSAWAPAAKGAMVATTQPVAPDTTAQARLDTTAAPSDTVAAATDTLRSDTTAVAEAPEAQRELHIEGFPEQNLNMTSLWAPTQSDTVYLRYRIELPPGWNELPDSLRERERPRPVIRKASITITADDDYVVYVNGRVTNARDQDAAVDWPKARTFEILKDQWLVGDTANVIAIRAANERRLNRVPDTDTTTFGVMARIDVEMDIPLDIYQILYKPPEPEPTFVLAFMHDDSMMLADTTGAYFRTPQQRDQWRACRERAIQAVWTDTVLVPWRLERAHLRLAELDTQVVRLRRWLVDKREAAKLRLAEAASQEMGIVPAAGDTTAAPPLEGPGGTEEQGTGEQGLQTPSDGANVAPQTPEESRPPGPTQPPPQPRSPNGRQ